MLGGNVIQQKGNEYVVLVEGAPAIWMWRVLFAVLLRGVGDTGGKLKVKWGS
jgi:hypothetical protein